MVAVARNPSDCCGVEPSECPCCFQSLRGAYVTVGGVVPCTDCSCEETNCGSINGTYYVPVTGVCAGSKVFQLINCFTGPPNNSLFQTPLEVSWGFLCPVGEVQLNVTVDEANTGGFQITLMVSAPIDCSELNGAVPRVVGNDNADCDFSSASCEIVFDFG